MIFSKYAILTVLAAVSFNNNVDAFTTQSNTRSLMIARPTTTTLPRANQPLFVSLSEVDGAAETEEFAESGEFGEDVAEEILSDADLAEMEDDGTVPFDDVNEEEDWYKHQLRITELRMTHRRHDKDTGSPEFQVAGMTERISYLTKHLQTHPKDFSTRRGLVALVNKRRRLLNYLCKENEEAYVSLVKSLGIRHKPPSKVRSRVEQYGRFPQQKAVKKHLLKKKK